MKKVFKYILTIFIKERYHVDATPHKDKCYWLTGIVGEHEWVDATDCTGNVHYFGRKCIKCQKVEATGRRKCGKSCPVYQKHLEKVKNKIK